MTFLWLPPALGGRIPPAYSASGISCEQPTKGRADESRTVCAADMHQSPPPLLNTFELRDRPPSPGKCSNGVNQIGNQHMPFPLMCQGVKATDMEYAAPGMELGRSREVVSRSAAAQPNFFCVFLLAAAQRKTDFGWAAAECGWPQHLPRTHLVWHPTQGDCVVE